MTEKQQELFDIEKLNVPRSKIPAVAHVDYTARHQTMHKEINPRYHRLLSRFKKLTGCPVLVNNSFNVQGEHIVCTPEDGFNSLMGTELAMLAVGNCVVRRVEQNLALIADYKNAHDLD